MKFHGLNRSLTLILVLIIVAVGIGACAQPSPTTQPAPTSTAPTAAQTTAATSTAPTTAKTSAATSAAPTTTQATTAPAQQKVIKLKAQCFNLPGTFGYDVLMKQWWIDNMNKAAGGKMVIELTGSGAIVPDGEVHSAIAKGILDMGVSISSYTVSALPVAKFDKGYPGQYEDMREVQVYNRSLGFLEAMREAYLDKVGVYLLDFIVDQGGELMSTKPFPRLADVKGAKIRMGGTVADIMAKAGANMVMMPGAELYTAVSTKLLDGALYGTIADAATIGLTDITKYCVRDILGATNSAIVLINPQVWQSLPEDLKKIIELGTYFAGSLGNLDGHAKRNGVFKAWQAKGGTVYRWPKEDWDQIGKWSLEMMEDLAKQDPKYGPKLLKIVKDQMATRS